MTETATPGPARRSRRPARARDRAALPRCLGALALLGVGVDHVEQYAVGNYSAIPTIGTLFLVNFVSATLASIGLAAPMTRLAGRRADAVRAILALSGIAIAGGALAGLVVSEHEPLFGFMEHGYRPAIIVAILLESVTAVSLTAFLALTAEEHA